MIVHISSKLWESWLPYFFLSKILKWIEIEYHLSCGFFKWFLVRPSIVQEVEELLNDVLKVEVFKPKKSCSFISGTYCALSNIGGLVSTHDMFYLTVEICNSSMGTFFWLSINAADPPPCYHDQRSLGWTFWKSWSSFWSWDRQWWQRNFISWYNSKWLDRLLWFNHHKCRAACD